MTPSRRLLTAALAMMMLLGMACSKTRTEYRQAARDFRKGELESSLNRSVEILSRKPKHSKSQVLLAKTWPRFLFEADERIRKFNALPREQALEFIIPEYEQLIKQQKLLESVHPFINAKTGEQIELELRDFEQTLADAKLEAAEIHYQNGLQILSLNNDPDAHRKAFNEFQTVVELVPQYKDTPALLARSRQFAIKRIAVGNFDDKSGSTLKYGSLIDLLPDMLISKLIRDPEIRKYWDIVSREDIEAILNEQQYGNPQSPDFEDENILAKFLTAHEIITGKIIQVNYVPERESEVDLRETKNIMSGKEAYYTNKGKLKERDVYKDVSCVYTKYLKTVSVRVTATFSLVEVSTGILKDKDTVTAEYVWTGEWARIKENGGDERALSEETMALIRKLEPLPPEESDMVNLAMNELTDKIVARFRLHLQNSVLGAN
ncbi:MAG: CsgG/HfaB family protein [Candidatus Cloacimonadaceae bacterium]|nr:hypothetical protein [Candidatus Cloacimonadota bacterium]MDX9949094.1 CsgG/HfaB family protein [Candidatus Syntrophosphaera sp.]